MRREVLVSLCLSVHTCWGGGVPTWPVGGGGYPSQVQSWGTPAGGSTPPGQGVHHLGYPPSDQAGGIPARGVPHLGYPYQTWPGGIRARGYPTLGTLIRPGQGVSVPGGTPPWVPLPLIRPDRGYPAGGGVPHLW